MSSHGVYNKARPACSPNAECRDARNAASGECIRSAVYVFNLSSSLEVASGIDSAIRVLVGVCRIWRERHAGAPFLPPDAISGRIQVVVLRKLLALLLAPETPGYYADAAEEDGSADSADDATDNGLGVRCQGAARAVAAAVRETGIDGRCCVAGGGSQGLAAGDDGTTGRAVRGPICGGGVVSCLLGEEGACDDCATGKGGAVDGAAANYD